MTKLIDYNYLGATSNCIALNGLCNRDDYFTHGKIVYYSLIGYQKPIASCKCSLNSNKQLPECIECLVTRIEGLYDKSNRL